MTYAEAIQLLYSLRVFGAKFGLENSFQLAELAGNPQDRLRFIHVAGTNGKGSTCAMLESIYRAAGLRVGLFTSPHLVSFRERIQVNRELISEGDVVRLVEELRPLLAKFPETKHPTFFEAVTSLALRYFAEQKCDLVIWETGLGGRLDATNIVTPLASVITNIGIDHAEWLGETIEKIAMEKAGIIKPRIPVVTGASQPEALAVIGKIARENNAPLTKVRSPKSAARSLDLPLGGEYQKQNATLAMAAVGILQNQIPVSEQQICTGLQNVHWPGRMQRVQTKPGQIILLDGAHNAAGAEALGAALRTEFAQQSPTLIFGVFRDKDSRGMCQSLATLAHRILVTAIQSERSEDPVRVADICREINPRAAVEACASLEEALEKSVHDPLVVIAGSLYLIGEAMEALHLSAATPTDEKSLNEWKPARR